MCVRRDLRTRIPWADEVGLRTDVAELVGELGVSVVRTGVAEVSTAEHGEVPAVDMVATVDDEDGSVTIMAVNRHPDQAATISVMLRGFPALRVASHLAIGGRAGPGGQAGAGGGTEPHDAAAPRACAGTTVSGEVLSGELQPASWNLIALTRAP